MVCELLSNDQTKSVWSKLVALAPFTPFKSKTVTGNVYGGENGGIIVGQLVIVGAMFSNPNINVSVETPPV